MEISNDGTDEIGIDSEICILCQAKTKEKLTDPSKLLRCTDVGKGYSTLADDLREFHKIKQLQSPHLEKLVSEHGDNIESYLKTNQVKWHKNCRRKYNSDKLKRVLKENVTEDIESIDVDNTDEFALSKIIEYLLSQKKSAVGQMVFKLSNLHENYIAYLGDKDTNSAFSSNITRFKNDLLFKLSDLMEYKYGRNIFVLFKEDLGRAIMEGCHKSKEDRLTAAATLIREDIANHS